LTWSLFGRKLKLECCVAAFNDLSDKEANMNANKKSRKDASPEAPNTEEIPETTMTTFATLLHRNVERLVDLQKTTLDTLREQSADVAEAMRQSLKSGPAAPSVAMLDVTEKGVQGWIGAQKDILDLLVQQSAQAVETARKRGGLASQSVAELSEFVQQAAERTVAAQKTMLDFAAEQNKVVAEAFRRQAGVKGSPVAEMAESVRLGVDTFIDMQKEFLDTATKTAKGAAARKG
jgi:hypothetical protein